MSNIKWGTSRANKTVREEFSPLVIENYREAERQIARIVHWYNNERLHSSLEYLTPRQYYRGNPEDLLRIREAKMEKARILRKERNMRERKGGETAGVVS